jgi:hypothetical protein
MGRQRLVNSNSYSKKFYFFHKQLAFRIGEQGMRTWWGYFKDLGLVDLVHTSGGQVK